MIFHRAVLRSARQFKSTATDGVEVFEWRRLGNMHPFAYEVSSVHATHSFQTAHGTRTLTLS